MPELPDVEGFRRTAEKAVKRSLLDVIVLDSSVLRNVSSSELQKALVSESLASASRHGKWLILDFSRPLALLHFGMTGLLEWQEHDLSRQRHDRVIFRFKAGDLVYRDQRKLQGLWLAEDSAQLPSIMGDLGPDAQSISWKRFDEAMDGHRGALKSLLMDQSVVSGLGNLMTDEILWQARLHPAVKWTELGAQQRRSLHHTVRSVIDRATPFGRVPDTEGWITSQRGEREPICPRCHSTLQFDRHSGRGSLWCPKCQPAFERNP